MKKYLVDERAGCIGIIDTTMERTRNGLNRNDPEVVWYRAGFRVPNICPTCKCDRGGEWALQPKIVEEAKSLCDWLNEGKTSVCINCNRVECVC